MPTVTHVSLHQTGEDKSISHEVIGCVILCNASFYLSITVSVCIHCTQQLLSSSLGMLGKHWFCAALHMATHFTLPRGQWPKFSTISPHVLQAGKQEQSKLMKFCFSTCFPVLQSRTRCWFPPSPTLGRKTSTEDWATMAPCSLNE